MNLDKINIVEALDPFLHLGVNLIINWIKLLLMLEFKLDILLQMTAMDFNKKDLDFSI
jgi:hypothetical protein